MKESGFERYFSDAFHWLKCQKLESRYIVITFSKSSPMKCFKTFDKAFHWYKKHVNNRKLLSDQEEYYYALWFMDEEGSYHWIEFEEKFNAGDWPFNCRTLNEFVMCAWNKEIITHLELK